MRWFSEGNDFGSSFSIFIISSRFYFNLRSCELAYMYAVTVTALYILLLTPCLVE